MNLLLWLVILAFLIRTTLAFLENIPLWHILLMFPIVICWYLIWIRVLGRFLFYTIFFHILVLELYWFHKNNWQDLFFYCVSKHLNNFFDLWNNLTCNCLDLAFSGEGGESSLTVFNFFPWLLVSCSFCSFVKTAL